MAWGIIFTIEDAKGKKSSVQINASPSLVWGEVVLVAQGFASILDQAIRGVIRSISVSSEVDLPGGIGLNPDADSDVEEGAKFQFLTDGGHYTNFRIPTFDEDLLLENGDVDETDGVVDTIIEATLGTYDFDPDPFPTNVVDDCLTDTRDEDIVSFVWGRENFISSRGSRP